MSQPSNPLPTQHANASPEARRRRRWLIAGLAGGATLLFLCFVTAALLSFVLLRTAGRLQTAGPAPGPADQARPAADSAAASLQPVNRIAFIDAAGRLGTVAPDGSSRRLLTPEGTIFQFPAWSPDSASLAAIGVDLQSAGVFVVADRETSEPQPLYRSAFRAPIYLYWSPDGSQISFIANDRAGLALHLVPADGSRESRILGAGQPFYWDWTTDGDQLLIHSGGLGENARLAFIDTEGQEIGQLVARPGLFQAPGISPSGRYSAFAAVEGESLQLVVQSRDGQERIALPQRGLVAMTWSPVADQLAFNGGIRGRAFFGPLNLLDVASGAVRPLSQKLVLAFFWSPDGRSIAYLTPDESPNDPGAWQPANSSQPIAHRPGSSQRQNGQGRRLLLELRVVDVASGQDRLLSRFQPTELFVDQFLPFFDQYALSHRVWSPASDAIVMPMVDGRGQEQVYVVPLSGNPPQAVAEGAIGFWSQR